MKKWKMGTRAIYIGEEEFNPEGAHTFPIYQTGTFVFKSLKEAARAFREELPGFVYARIDNPNFRVVEEKIASLEKGEDALVFPSGMAAINLIIQYLAQAGGHVISTEVLYGCTDELFSNILPQLGISISLVDTRDPENIKKAIKENTKVIFLETPANPTLVLADIKAISEIAHQKGIFVVVDNSFATPYNQRPIELGADFVVHSITKYLNGHGDVIMGGVAGRKALIRERKESLFHWRGIIGSTPSPHDCALVTRGLKTFALRMERHNSNALKLARFLENHPAVAKVYYPGLESFPQHELAKRQMLKASGEPGYGGMISFELKGGLKTTRRFFKHLIKESFITLAVSLGYIETLIQSPALMTHALVPKNTRLKKGITDSLIRLSVGIEDYEDIERAFGQALDKIK